MKHNQILSRVQIDYAAKLKRSQFPKMMVKDMISRAKDELKDNVQKKRRQRAPFRSGLGFWFHTFAEA